MSVEKSRDGCALNFTQFENSAFHFGLDELDGTAAMAFGYGKIKKRTRLLVDEALNAVKAGFSADDAQLKPLELTQLEQRILMSASPAAVVIDAVDAAAQSSASQAEFAVELAAVDSAQQEQTDSQNAASAQTTVELVVIDPSAENHKQLVADIQSQADRQFEILILDPREDGIVQITDELDSMRDVSAIHLVSHGSEGEILLGASVLSQRTIGRYAAEMVTWQHSMTADADLLIYGCDLAASDSGLELTESLNVLLGADIAASNDLTGHADRGGDWELEVAVGAIETSVAFTAEVQNDWQGLLALTSTGELPVNTTTTDIQETSGEDRGSQQAVSVAADGSYVVVWSSINQDTSGWGIYARRFDSTGAAITGEIPVNTTTTDNQRWAGVAADAAGNFVVTWTGTNQDGTPQSVYARWFDSDGNAPASEFRVNSTNTGVQKDSSIAMNAAGEFVISWQGEGAGDSEGIWYRRFNNNQIAIDTSDVRANETDRASEADTDIAMNDAGQFAITWHVDGDSFIRHFASDGSAVSGDIQVDSNLANVVATSVGIDSTGRTVVAHRSNGVFGIGQGVWARTFEADGSERHDLFQIAGSDATSPSIDMAADGSFVVAWEGSGDSDGKGVYVRQYNANSDAKNQAALVTNVTETGDQQMASVGLLDLNNFVVVWSGAGTDDNAGILRRQIHVENPFLDLDANNNSGATGSDFIASFPLGSGPISVVDSDAVLADPDGANLESLTVRITDRQDGGNEVLAANVAGTAITANYSSSSGTLRLSGTDSVANYQTVLRSITYDNTQNPATGTSRAITFIANDGIANSNLATTTVSLSGTPTAILTPAADTYITKDDSAFNYGTANSLIVNKGGGNIGNERSLLRFDFSSIPAGATITGATLELTATSVSGDFGVSAYEVTESWDEGTGNGGADTASWDERTDGVAWTDTGGTYAPTAIDTFSATTTGTHSWNILSLVEAWSDGSKANNGLILGSEDTGNETVIYDSSEGSTSPRLVITYEQPSNNLPSANAGGPYAINAGESLNLDATGSSDPDNDLLTYLWDLDNDGNFAETNETTGVTPTVSWANLQELGIDTAGSHTIGLLVSDGKGGVDTTTTTLTVTSNAAVAADDSATTNNGTAVNINLIDNDTDPTSNGLTVIDVSAPAGGTVVNNFDGTITYTPDATFAGTDSFSYVVGNQSDGLDHFYSLDGSAIDTVGNADGVLRNGVSTVAGASGQALSFDEIDDYVELPDIDYSDEFSVSFKFKIDESAGADYMYLFSHGDHNSVNSLNVLLGEDSRPGFAGTIKTIFGDTNDSHDLNALNFDASAVVGDGDWHTYTLTVDAINGASVYLDGVLRASDGTRGGDAFNPTGSLFLGSRWDLDANRFFGGSLDSLAVFDRPLESGEVSALNAAALTTNFTSSANVSVVVQNGAPTADAGPAYSIAEGNSLTLDGSSSSDPNNDTLTYEWDLNYDGTTFTSDVTGETPDIAWSTLVDNGIGAGTSTIALRVNDGVATSVLDVATLTVNSSRPGFSVVGDSTVGSGETYTLNLSYSGAGSNTLQSWTVNWGDGTINTYTGSQTTVTHVYTNGGFTNNITYSVVDESGSYTDARLAATSADSNEIYFLDNTGESTTQIVQQPTDIIQGPDGLLYVSNFASNDIDRVDPVTGEYVDTFVINGLSNPSRLAFGPDGSLYVASRGNDLVVRYGNDGRFLGNFTTGITEPDGLNFDDDGNLYITSFQTGDIFKFDGSTGTQIGTGPFASFGKSTFIDVNFGPNGNLFASSNTDNVIREFDSSGNAVGDFGGGPLTDIVSVAGFTWGPEGHLYVADFGGNKLAEYSANGTFIGTFGQTVSAPINVTFTSALQVKVNETAVGAADSYSVNEGETLSVATIADWDSPSWKQRQKVVFDNFTSTSTLNSIPVLVKLHATASDAINIDYNSTRDQGADIRFVDSDGTLLSHDIEEWDESGYSYIWVQVPSINAASATDFIWMYYDNDTSADGHNSDATWNSDYKAIFHLNGTSADATSGNNDAGITSVFVAPGIVAGAGLFDGSNSKMDVGSDSSVDNVFAGGGTISAWINPTSSGEQGFGRIVDKASGAFAGNANADGWALQVAGIESNNGRLLFEHGFSGGQAEWQTQPGSITAGVWQNVVLTFDTDSTAPPKIYIDGAEITLTEVRAAVGTARLDADAELTIGNNSASNRTFDGSIDEVRISSATISAEQIAAEYQSVVGNFVSSTGPVESGPGGLLSNDVDLEGDPLTVNLLSGPTNAAAFTLNPDGSFSYAHDGSETTSDEFTYTLTDGRTTSEPVTASISVAPTNDAPTISAVANVSSPEGTTIGPITLTIGDAETDANSLVLTATSSDQSLIADSAIALGGSGTSRTISLTPAANATGGPATITLTVSDGVTSTFTTFEVTITGTNDAPTVSSISDLSTPENTTASVSFTIDDLETNPADLVVTAVSSDQSLVSNGGLIFTGSGTNRSLEMTPVANANGGPVEITVRVSDGTTIAESTFNLTVTSVNSTPTISTFTNQTINEDTSSSAINFTVNDIDHPAAGLTVTATSSDQSIIQNGDITLSGTGSNRTIQFTPVTNASGGPVTIELTVSDGESSVTESFDVTVTSADDLPTISPIGDVTIPEDSATGTITFNIDDIDTPTTALTVTATSSDQSLIADSGITLGGSGANRTISVVPVANASGGRATITVSVSDGINTSTETFSIRVTPVNDAPTISVIPNVTTVEDTPVGPFNFTVADIDNAAANLTVTAVSDDQSLVRDADIILGGTAQNRTISLTPAPNANGGPATITVSVFDGTAVVTETFQVTVTAVNDAPTIESIPNVTTPEDIAPATYTFTIGDAETPADQLIVTATSSNQQLIPDTDIVLGGSSHQRTISVTPTAEASGTATITIVVSDGTTTTEETFDVVVTPVNDAPTISTIPNVTTVEDTPVGPFNFTVADIDNAAANLTVTAVSDDQSLVRDADIILGGTAQNRTISLTPAPNANGGPATITVSVFDGTAVVTETFQVTVTAVNDAPTIESIPNVTTPEDIAPATYTFTIGDAETPAEQLIITATSSNQQLIPDTDIVLGGSSHQRTISVTPTAEASGTATITIVVSDGTTTTEETFDVVVTPVNDAPTISTIPDVTTEEDTGTGIFEFTVSDIESDSEDLTVTATSSNQDVVVDSKISLGGSAGNRTISISPEQNAVGSVTITVTVSDGDQTSSQSFTTTINAVNDAPVISEFDDITIGEDTQTGPLAFRVRDVDNLNRSLVVTTSSSNQGLIANEDIWVAGGGTNRNLYFRPMPNQFGGPVTITVSVTDGELTSQTDFVVNVTPINDAPEFSADTKFDFVVPDNQILNFSTPILLQGVTDAENDTTSAVVATKPLNGQLELHADGSFQYTAEDTTAASDWFEFYVTDGQAKSALQRVNLTLPTIVSATIVTETYTAASSQSYSDAYEETTQTEVAEAEAETQNETPQVAPELAVSAARQRTDSEAEDDDIVARPTNMEDDEDSAPIFNPIKVNDQITSSSVASESSVDIADAERVTTSALGFSSISTNTSNINSAQIKGANFVFTTSIDYESFSDVKGAVEQIETLKESLDTRIDLSNVAANTVAVTATSVMVGTVFTAVRTGVLALGFLTQLPVWTMFDPLMVMDGVSGEEGDSLEEMVDRNAKESEASKDKKPSE